MAIGEIIIAQSDDVIHHSSNTIDQLTNLLQPGKFLIAQVWNVKNQERLEIYTGMKRPRPFFFLGSLYRKDLYAVGGNDEEFVSPGYDDDWFGDCLMRGLKLIPKFLEEVVGYHQDHPRPHNPVESLAVSCKVYQRKVGQAFKGQIPWQASGGPWEYSQMAQQAPTGYLSRPNCTRA